MHWSGNIDFGEAWVAFRGQHSDNRPHSHAALQLVVVAQGYVTVASENDEETSAPGIAIRSGVVHRLLPGERCTLFLIEPQSQLAAAILARLAEGAISALPQDLTRELSSSALLSDVVRQFRSHLGAPAQTIDPRLLAAVAWIASHDESGSVAIAASQSGLSPARLRALATEQLGVPLAKLVLWHKVKAASQSLLTGSSLSDAAAAAGFADQAHLTRTMGSVLGITPATAKTILG